MLSRRRLLIGAAVLTPIAYAIGSGRRENSVEKLRNALLDQSRSVRVRIIGDSISWGANASGTREFISSRTDPHRGTLKDTRAPLSAPSYANLLREWLAETYFAGSRRSAIRGGVRYEGSGRYFHFVNDGISGTSTDKWLPGGRLLDDGKKYDFVICMLGTNDRGTNAALPHRWSRTVRNLHAILEYLEHGGASVILATPNIVSPARDLDGAPQLYAFSQADVAGAIRKVAYDRPSIGLVDCYTATSRYDTNRLLSDGLHPSDHGHRVMFEEFRRSIEVETD